MPFHKATPLPSLLVGLISLGSSIDKHALVQ